MTWDFKRIWEFWVFATFQPSKLKNLLSAVSQPEEPSSSPIDYLLFSPNPKIILYFILLVFLFNIPLMGAVLIYGEGTDYYLLVFSIATSYLAGLLSLPLGIHLPLVYAILFKSSYVNSVFTEYSQHLFLIPIIVLVWIMLCFIINANSLIPNSNKYAGFKRLTNSSILATLITILLAEISLFLYQPPSYNLYQIAFVVWLISYSTAPSDFNMSGVFIVPVIMLVLMIYYKNPYWLLPTLVVPLGFLRLFPDYLIWSLLCACFLTVESRTNGKSVNYLTKLPPFVNEILWLSIVGHRRLITIAFKKNPDQSIFWASESITHSSINNPFMLALPDIVFEYLSNPKSVVDLSIFGDKNIPLVKLVSLFSASTSSEVRMGMSQSEIEVEVLLPRIVRISEKIKNLLSSKVQKDSYLLRDIKAQFSDFETFLLGLNLRTKKKKKWIAVLTKWKTVFEDYVSAA